MNKQGSLIQNDQNSSSNTNKTTVFTDIQEMC